MAGGHGPEMSEDDADYYEWKRIKAKQRKENRKRIIVIGSANLAFAYLVYVMVRQKRPSQRFLLY